MKTFPSSSGVAYPITCLFILESKISELTSQWVAGLMVPNSVPRSFAKWKGHLAGEELTILERRMDSLKRVIKAQGD